jgi:hypothetical protein
MPQVKSALEVQALSSAEAKSLGAGNENGCRSTGRYCDPPGKVGSCALDIDAKLVIALDSVLCQSFGARRVIMKSIGIAVGREFRLARRTLAKLELSRGEVRSQDHFEGSARGNEVLLVLWVVKTCDACSLV